MTTILTTHEPCRTCGTHSCLACSQCGTAFCSHHEARHSLKDCGVILREQRDRAYALLTHCERIAGGHWPELPRGMYRDVSLAWMEYNGGQYTAAYDRAHPAHTILVQMAERYGWGS